MSATHEATKSSIEAQLPAKKHEGDERSGPKFTKRQRFTSSNWTDFSNPTTITTESNTDFTYKFDNHFDTSLDSGGVLIQGLQCSSSTGSTTSFADGTEKLFYHLQLKIGGKVVYTRRLDLINTILYQFRVDDVQTIGLQESLGKGIRSDRITLATTAQDYFIPWSFFWQQNLFPAKSLFGKSGLDLEIVLRLREAKYTMECASGTVPTYTFTGFKTIGDYVEGDHTVDFEKDGWTFFDTSYYRKTEQLLSGATAPEIELKPNRETCTRLVAIFRPKANVDIFASQDKEEIWVKDNIDTYNLTTELGPITSAIVPVTNVVSMKHLYTELLSTWATHDESRLHQWPPQFASNITWLDFSAQSASGLYKFCISHDFRRSAEPDVISGESFINNRTLKLALTSTAGLSQNLQADIFIEYITPVVVHSDGSYTGLSDASRA